MYCLPCEIDHTLLEIVKGSKDSLEFCTALFCPKPVVSKCTDVSILYLNQICGPTHLSWNFCNRIFDECGLPFLESRLQPDSWCNQYISNSLSKMCNKLSFEDMELAENCEIINRVNPHNKNNSFDNLNMNKTFKQSKFQTDVFFCIPQIELLQHRKKNCTWWSTLRILQILSVPLCLMKTNIIGLKQFIKRKKSFPKLNTTTYYRI